MKKIYFLLFIALFQQSLELNWNPWSTLGKSLWDSKDFLFRLIFPKKNDIVYYSKQLDQKVEELNKRNYNPKGYKICNPKPSTSIYVFVDEECGGMFPTNNPKIAFSRVDAIKKFLTDELNKCMHGINQGLEDEFKRLMGEIGLPAAITKSIADRAMSICRGTVCPLGVCQAVLRCSNNQDIGKALRMGEIIVKSADAFIPCAKSLLDRQY